MARGRSTRQAPNIAVDPLDAYSTWDIRIAKWFLYSIIISSAILVLGTWGWILDTLIKTGKLDLFTNLHIGLQIAIIAAAITGHFLLLVLFYTLFRGGILKICRVVFKDKKVAKKWEDFATLRWLIGVTVVGTLFTIFFILVGTIPGFGRAIGQFFVFMFAHLDLWRLIFDFGVFLFMIIGIVFLLFFFWNHGVYYVLKNIKQIEEEIEVDERIKKGQLKNADKKTLQKVYNRDTGRKATYRGQETKGFIEWKKKMLD
ncbi:MAG: hypothetical protein KGD63_02045 [Candidatus Lokiarchaeota archaeon]|nr:hypothetical protein [Candidatus Lokiarchaeota archaeon]